MTQKRKSRCVIIKVAAPYFYNWKRAENQSFSDLHVRKGNNSEIP